MTLPTGESAAACGQSITGRARVSSAGSGYLCESRRPATRCSFPKACRTNLKRSRTAVRRSIQTQILLPFSVTIVVAVAVIAISSSWLAVRQAELRTLVQLRGVASTLSRLTVPFTESVLVQMRGLSGAEFIALDRSGRISASTVRDVSPSAFGSLLESLPPRSTEAERTLAELPVVDMRQTRFLADRVAVIGPANVATLLVLYPEADWQAARQAALWPPLIVGAVTVVVVIGISTLLARSIGRRVQTVQRLLAAIAAGESPASDVPAAPRDELDDLVVSASQVATELDQLRETVQQTERVRLLGQLAGGLAHQLRNAVTGARLAVQLHQKRCLVKNPGTASKAAESASAGDGSVSGRLTVTGEADESLAVALRQLALTEDQIQRLLSLNRQETPDSEPVGLSDLVGEIEQLIRPHADHARVELSVSSNAKADSRVADAERFRAAVMNLLLNAIEAAGSEGRVWFEVRSTDAGHCVTVSDDGPGPSPDVAASLFEPFVTSKPEGVGLGLALARQVARDLGGDLTWSRRQERTVFEFLFPDSGSVR
ncbi:HAMP domain-containing protein [bacterium]|nr:HAMP domain-containing protein [bacterium]